MNLFTDEENPKYEIEEAIQTISNKFSTLNDEYLRMSNVGERIRIDNERYQKQLMQMFTQMQKLDSENQALSKAIDRATQL